MRERTNIKPKRYLFSALKAKCELALFIAADHHQIIASAAGSSNHRIATPRARAPSAGGSEKEQPAQQRQQQQQREHTQVSVGVMCGAVCGVVCGGACLCNSDV